MYTWPTLALELLLEWVRGRALSSGLLLWQCFTTWSFLAGLAMAPHSSTLAWKIPWTEEPNRLQSMGSLRVRHNWATSLSLFTFHFSLSCTGEGNGNPLQCSCLENPRDGGAWWAAIYGVAQSWTQWKRCSSSSSSSSSSMRLKAETLRVMSMTTNILVSQAIRSCFV